MDRGGDFGWHGWYNSVLQSHGGQRHTRSVMTAAEISGEATPYGFQHLLGRADWEADALRDELRRYLIQHLGDSDAVLVLDETGFLKKGLHSAALPANGWRRLSAGEGAKGPRWYDWSWQPLDDPADPQWRRWLLVRRSCSDPKEMTAYVVFAPWETPLPQVVRVAGTRWSIESGFEAAKGEVGLDDYEVRS